MALTTALVTGASSGIGYEISKILAAAGHDLVLVARREDRLQQLAKFLTKEFKINVRVYPADLTRLEQIDTLYQTLDKENIPVDILVNNAGFGDSGPFTAADAKQQAQQIQLNVEALTYLTNLFAKDMVKRGLGKILNIASVAGYMPGPYMAVYYATKAYVVSFSEALRIELKGTGVSVTVACPGITNSEFHQVAGTDRVFFFRLVPMMSSAQVARASINAMNKRKGVYIPGTFNRLSVLLGHFTPNWFLLRILKLIMKPRGQR